ncbi:MAG: hypothetical protein ACE5KU_01655 [Nitrososphaerales archaeon]
MTVTKVDGEWLRIQESCNPIHVCDVHRVGEKAVIFRDKHGRTAWEKARRVFKVGEKAIETILGDFYVTVLEVRENGCVVVAINNDPKNAETFRPRLFSGEWGWWTQGRYSLRPEDGTFYEYSD